MAILVRSGFFASVGQRPRYASFTPMGGACPVLGLTPAMGHAHFNIFGWHEGRDPNAFFDTAGYLSHYGDVATASVNPVDHYMQYGWREGRDPSAHFDTLGYLAANLDVAPSGVNPLDHYLTFGIYEGRTVVNDGFWG